MSIIWKLNDAECYLTAPAVRPLTMCFSMIRPITINGVIAAVESAAIDHQLIPCEPVWLATITGRVLAIGGGQQRGEEVLVPAEDERQDEGGDHPGSAIGTTIEERRPRSKRRRLAPPPPARPGSRLNWSRMIQMTIGQHHQRVNQIEPDAGVEEPELPVEHEEGQREHHRRQDQLREEQERNVLVAHRRSGS